MKLSLQTYCTYGNDFDVVLSLRLLNFSNWFDWKLSITQEGSIPINLQTWLCNRQGGKAPNTVQCLIVSWIRTSSQKSGLFLRILPDYGNGGPRHNKYIIISNNRRTGNLKTSHIHLNEQLMMKWEPSIHTIITYFTIIITCLMIIKWVCNNKMSLSL